jgi:hypothetical protein
MYSVFSNQLLLATFMFFSWIILKSSVSEIIDPVFAKTSQNARFLLSENERFGLVFVKTGSINSGTGHLEYDDPIVQVRVEIVHSGSHSQAVHPVPVHLDIKVFIFFN